MNERYKETIKYQTEVLRVFFVILLTDLTGVVSMFKKGALTTNELKLFIAGLLVILAILIIFFKLNREIISGIKLR